MLDRKQNKSISCLCICQSPTSLTATFPREASHDARLTFPQYTLPFSLDCGKKKQTRNDPDYNEAIEMNTE